MHKLLSILLLAWPLAAQLPEHYKAVDRVIWVVDDAARITEAWKKVGLAQVEDQDDFDLAPGQKIRMVSGFLGDVRVQWVQPLGGQNPVSDFLKNHGIGIFSLVHRMPTLEAFEGELARMQALGVGLVGRGELKTSAGSVQYAFLDTQREGKYSLGLIYLPPDLKEPAPSVSPDKKIVQFAFAIRDIKPVSAYWEKLGLGPLATTQANLSNVQYYGKPIPPDLDFGWQRNRKLVYEWLRPVAPPNIYDDHIKAHGEGLQHLALQVQDMEVAVAGWVSQGFKVAQSGAWGEAGKKGSGRFSFIDTESIGGFMVELLWNYR